MNISSLSVPVYVQVPGYYIFSTIFLPGYRYIYFFFDFSFILKSMCGFQAGGKQVVKRESKIFTP